VNKFIPLTTDQYAELVAEVPDKYKEILSFINERQLCSVGSLLEGFPQVAEEASEMVKALGKSNGVLYRKYGVVIYPVEVASSIIDSAYSLGKFVEVKQ